MTTMTDPCKNTTHMQLMEHSGILTVAINTALGTLAFLGPIFRHIGADSSYLAGLTQQLNLIGSRPVPDPSPALLTDVCQFGTLPIIAVQQTNVIDTLPTTQLQAGVGTIATSKCTTCLTGIPKPDAYILNRIQTGEWAQPKRCPECIGRGTRCRIPSTGLLRSTRGGNPQFTQRPPMKPVESVKPLSTKPATQPPGTVSYIGALNQEISSPADSEDLFKEYVFPPKAAYGVIPQKGRGRTS